MLDEYIGAQRELQLFRRARSVVRDAARRKGKSYTVQEQYGRRGYYLSTLSDQGE